MSNEETTASTWQSWLLDAIHKIRYQKQRPGSVTPVPISRQVLFALAFFSA